MNRLIAMSLAATAWFLVADAAPLSLVLDGKPTASIVIAADAPDTVTRAATELQAYFERSTGARLEILTDQRPAAGTSIFVGESRFTADLGIAVDAAKPDGYRWRTGDDWLAIVGRDHRGAPVTGLRNPWLPHEVYNSNLKLGAFGEAGTLYGVYHFLEQFLGVRWFMPGDSGTVVPEHATVSIPALDVARAPDFEYRYPWFCNFDASESDALWFRHVGFGGASPVQAIDSFRMFLKYKDDHPDWFALVDGERDFSNLCCITGGGNLCLSNEELLHQMAADIRDYFDAHPGQRFFPVAPNDGMIRICGCEQCASQVAPDAQGHSRFSNYMWGFVNRLAEEVARTHPDHFVGTIAYEGYRDPPDNLARLHPNVAVMICQTRGSFADPDRLRAARDVIQRWQAKTDHLYLWEYYRYNLPPFPWAPAAYPHLIAADLRFLKGISRGEFIEAESWDAGQTVRMHYPAMQHLNLYVTAKCMWDADLDVDALLQDYYTGFYGPAADPMAAFWQRAEAIHTERPLAEAVTKYPTKDLDEMLALLNQAVDATATGTPYRQRVDLVRDDLKKLRDALGTLLVDAASEMDCHLAAGAIQIDGLLDDAAWCNALPQGLVLRSGEAPPCHSWLVSTHGDSHLYVGISNVEPAESGTETRDDERIEVFLAPKALDPKEGYHLTVDTAGATRTDAYEMGDPGPGPFGSQPVAWACEGLRVAVGRTNTRWTVELAIPLEQIGLRADGLPERIAMNVYRSGGTGEGLVRTVWSPPMMEQRDTPDQFGTLWLKDTQAPAVDANRLVPQSTDSIGSGAAGGPGWYTPGGVLAGKPFVGNPNTLTRKDRMVIRFDLAPLALSDGESGVSKASLRLIPVGVSGPEDTRRLELSHLQYDTAVLSWKDIVNEQATVVDIAEAHRDTVIEAGLTFDVTQEVNADLALGRPAAAFRLRDLGSEAGNTDMAPDGVCFPALGSGNLRLELE